MCMRFVIEWQALNLSIKIERNYNLWSRNKRCSTLHTGIVHRSFIQFKSKSRTHMQHLFIKDLSIAWMVLDCWLVTWWPQNILMNLESFILVYLSFERFSKTIILISFKLKKAEWIHSENTSFYILSLSLMINRCPT